MTVVEDRETGAQLHDVSYWYPRSGRPVLDSVSWDISRGDFVVVTGPSGSGKSTMLRCLNGLVPHFSGGRFGGEARVCGFDTRRHGPRDLAGRVGFVFQDPEAQSVARIVEDDIAFGLEQRGTPPALMRKRVEEVLDLLGIAGLRRRDVTTLSGGERQRVALAGVLVLQPELLVLDEPTSQLDPWGADEIITALHRLNDDLGLTVVMAEHRLERVAMYADQLRIVMRGHRPFDTTPAAGMCALPDHDRPPLARLAVGAGWPEAPLTIKEARRMLPRAVRSLEPVPPVVHPSAEIATINRITVEREKVPVLHDISLSMYQSHITAIMGRNGAGKSTLLRALLGMIPLRSGRIEVAGRNMSATEPVELAGIAGFLPQDPSALLFAERLWDELAFTLKHRPPGIDWPARNPKEILRELDLVGLEDRHPRDLSVGERERAALAAVLVNAPRLLVLDEPTRGMDGSRKQALMRILARERDAGAAIVMATHDVELVAEWADRVILMGDGEIVADGAPGEILSGSLTFATQINKLFGGTALTVEHGLELLRMTAGRGEESRTITRE
jgi:energy-coupling factor transport system ATP-binding protein